GETGAVNTSALDSFTYTLAGGNTVTVTVTVNGIATADDWLLGDSGDNMITGTAGGDLFMVQQGASPGGHDTLAGGGGNDIFYYGGALIAADRNDGGSGRDAVVLQGNYVLTLGAHSLDNM